MYISSPSKLPAVAWPLTQPIPNPSHRNPFWLTSVAWACVGWAFVSHRMCRPRAARPRRLSGGGRPRAGRCRLQLPCLRIRNRARTRPAACDCCHWPDSLGTCSGAGRRRSPTRRRCCPTSGLRRPVFVWRVFRSSPGEEFAQCSCCFCFCSCFCCCGFRVRVGSSGKRIQWTHPLWLIVYIGPSVGAVCG